MTVQLEYINHLLLFFKNISYYASIMLNVFIALLCSKLCWHNRLVPTKYIASIASKIKSRKFIFKEKFANPQKFQPSKYRAYAGGVSFIIYHWKFSDNYQCRPI